MDSQLDPWCGIHGYRNAEGCPGCPGEAPTAAQGRPDDECSKTLDELLAEGRDVPDVPVRPGPSAAKDRAARCWAAWFSSMTTILAWKCVSPWAAFGWAVGLLVLALFFDFGFEVRRARR